MKAIYYLGYTYLYMCNIHHVHRNRISLLDPYCRVCFVDRCLSFCAFLLAIGLSTRLHCTDSDYLDNTIKINTVFIYIFIYMQKTNITLLMFITCVKQELT
jgi:hypothetical protein